MEIILNVKLDENNKSIHHLDEQSLIKNHDNFVDIVSGKCKDYDFKITIENMYYIYSPTKGKCEFIQEDNLESINLLQLTKDFMNEESCLHNILSNIHDFDNVLDLNERETLLFELLIKDYINCIVNDNYKCNDYDNYRLFVSYYIPYEAYFKYPLPLDIMDKYVTGSGLNLKIDLKKLTAGELIKYVLPYYYQDLNMWDRKYIKNDTGLMSELTLKWLDISRVGSLD